MRLVKRLQNEIKALEQKANDRREILVRIRGLQPLSSVGAFIEASTGLVFPSDSNGDPSLGFEGNHASDTPDEWRSSLSDADFCRVTYIEKALKG